MKKHEEGQGLVPYALILMLVAITFLGLELQYGPALNDVFSQTACAVVNSGPHRVTMGIGDESVTFDVRESVGANIAGVTVEFGELDTSPLHGTVDNHGHGTFTYHRNANELDSGTDDGFTFVYECRASECAYFWGYIGSVTIIVGEPDPSLSVASILSGAEQTPLELDDVRESIEVLWEQAMFQEESLEEGTNLAVEGVVEGLEVLIDYADDLDEQALSESLSLIMDDVKGGNLGDPNDVPDAINLLLDEFPPEVQTAMSLKMAPRLTGSCEAVSDGLVSADAIEAAEQAVEQLDEDHPGKAEVQQLLGEAVDIIEERNFLIGQWLDYACGD